MKCHWKYARYTDIKSFFRDLYACDRRQWAYKAWVQRRFRKALSKYISLIPVRCDHLSVTQSELNHIHKEPMRHWINWIIVAAVAKRFIGCASLSGDLKLGRNSLRLQVYRRTGILWQSLMVCAGAACPIKCPRICFCRVNSLRQSGAYMRQ